MAIDGNSPRKQKNGEIQDVQTNDIDDVTTEHADDNSDYTSEEDEMLEEEALTKIKFHASTKLNNKDLPCQTASLHLKQFMEKLGMTCLNLPTVVEDHGKWIQCKENTTVLRKGSTNSDMFVIVEGEVAMMTSNRQVFKIMKAGEIFGDLSALFGLPVTATVKIGSSPTLLMALNKSGVKSLFPEPPKDLTDWCIRRHFLPTSDELDSGRVYRRMTLESLKNVPMYHDWPESAIKQLIMSMEGGLVTLYPDQSMIVMIGDPLTTMFVVVYGRLEVYASDLRKIINVTSHTDPFVFTEAAVIENKLASQVSIRALDGCQVIQIKQADVKKVMETYPDVEAVSSENCRLMHLAFKQMCRPLIGYQHLLYAELVAYDMKQAAKYKGSSTLAMMNKIIGGDLVRVKDGGVILKPEERLSIEAILVIDGRCVYSNSVTSLGTSDLFDKGADEENEKQSFFTSGDVIDVENDVMSDIIIADIESLVLMINRNDCLGDNYSANAATCLKFV